MSTDPSPPLRIGNTERTAAIRALDEHLAAGRLGIDEYADRTAAATSAVVAADLAALFTDLPEPHPQLPGSPTAPLQPVTPAPVAQPPSGRRALANWGPHLMPIAVIVAIGLFLVMRQGSVFVLIPLAAVLLYMLRRR
jgi:uncharacterized protein DUF1707